MQVSMDGMAVALALAGFMLGALVVALWTRSHLALALDRERNAAAVELLSAQERLGFAHAEAERLKGELALVHDRHRLTGLECDRLRQQSAQQAVHAGRVPGLERQLADALLVQRRQAEQLAALRTTLEAERSQSEEKLALLNEAREQLGLQFQNLANRILEEKSEKFTRQNQLNLGALLNPLQERIQAFQEQVASTYDRDSKERLSLQNEIERLVVLNHRISADAVNLTQALKGSNKTQGIWGEMVLENVLESSGLRKGQDYVVQESQTAESGRQQRPDVVIRLPEDRHMVIDAKMSLLGYERYCNAETEPARQAALREHLQSLRNHVRGLSEKNYQNLHGLKSLDFVLMFIPVEPAFMLAVTSDHSLFNDAFARNVLLVSPSTLLATLRTIANLWRQEQQNRNALAIAEQCARLYDKFVGFVSDVEEIGKRLEQTRVAYEHAQGKLVRGRGNLIVQVDRLRQLGVKPGRTLPAALLDQAQEAEDESTATGDALRTGS